MAGANDDAFDAVVSALVAGEPALVPTDTLFGIAVSPLHCPDPGILYEIKGRPSSKPVAWLVSQKRDLEIYGADVPPWVKRLAEAFWPGALTLIVRASESVPPEYQSVAGTIGLRMPDDVLVRVIADEVGNPLAVTSANLSGQADPQRFCDIDPVILAQVAAAIDDEQEKSGVGSTVLDCTGETYKILRAGGITQAAIDAVLNAPAV